MRQRNAETQVQEGLRLLCLRKGRRLRLYDLGCAHCPECGQTLFKKAGKGRNKPFCINENCSKFLPEDQRGYYRKKTAETAETAEEPEEKPKKSAAKKTAAKKTTTKKTTTKKTTKKEA